MAREGFCPDPHYEVLRPYKTASDWLNCSTLALLDGADPELVDAAHAAALAEEDYKAFLIEKARSEAEVRR